METMFMKVNKEWMATVDAKFVAYSEGKQKQWVEIIGRLFRVGPNVKG
jgi:hypothetical protein